jgi:hypothetical protein
MEIAMWDLEEVLLMVMLLGKLALDLLLHF